MPEPISTTIDNPQLKRFLDKVHTLAEQYDKLSAPPLPMPVALAFSTDDMGSMLQEFAAQYYKYYHALPGALIPLSSYLAVKNRCHCYATRDSSGEFSFVMYYPSRFQNRRWGIDLTSDSLKIGWSPYQALQIKMNFLLGATDSYLSAPIQSMLDEHRHHYLFALNKQRSNIEALNINDQMAIPSTSDIPLPYSCVIFKDGIGAYTVLIEKDITTYYALDYSTIVLNKIGDYYLEQSAIDLLRRLREAHDQWAQNPMLLNTPILDNAITKGHLMQAYQYMLHNPSVLCFLSQRRSVRLSKEMTQLPRTLNIVYNDDHQYQLMLEAKRKRYTPLLIDYRVIGEGPASLVKPAWVVDRVEPEKWANKVLYNEGVTEADYESLFSQRIFADLKNINPESIPINHTFLGELFYNKFRGKRSQYSKCAMGDLLEYIKKIPDGDKPYIMKDILEGIYMMHEQGKVHQDIKPGNLFVYLIEGRYRVKLSDFGNSFDIHHPSKKEAMATAGYESPEILLSAKDPKARQHRYLFVEGLKHLTSNSYAYAVYQEYFERTQLRSDQAIEYAKPHFANDMWAIGIVFFQLLSTSVSLKPVSKTDHDLIASHALLAGLLSIDRDKRLSAKQSLEKCYQMFPELPRLIAFPSTQLPPRAKPLEAVTPAPINPYLDVCYADLDTSKKQVYLRKLQLLLESNQSLAKQVLKGLRYHDLTIMSIEMGLSIADKHPTISEFLYELVESEMTNRLAVLDMTAYEAEGRKLAEEAFADKKSAFTI